MKKFALLAVMAAVATANVSSAHADHDHDFSPNSTEITNGAEGTNSTSTAVAVDFPKYAAVLPVAATTSLVEMSSTDYTQNRAVYSNVITSQVRTNSSAGLSVWLAAADVTGTFVADGNVDARTHVAGYGSNGFMPLTGTSQPVISTTAAILNSYKNMEIDLRYRNLAQYQNGTYSQNLTFTVVPN